MKSRNLICLLLAVIMLLICVSGAVAEGEVLLSVDVIDAEVDAEVEVAINISNASSIDSIQCNLNYDPLALEYLSDMPGLLFQPEYCITNPDVPGCFRLAAASTYGLSADGVLLTITFKVLSDTGSAITLSDVEISRVKEDYTQDKTRDLDFFMLTTDGGVSVDGKALPMPLATPWLAPTPPPTPEPTPEPTEEPASAVATASTEEKTQPSLPQSPSKQSMLKYILVVVIILFVIAIIVIVYSSVQKKKKRRRRKKSKTASHYHGRNYR